MQTRTRPDAIVIARLAVILLLPTTLAIVIGAFVLFDLRISGKIETIQQNEKKYIEIAEYRTSADLAPAISDIRYLAQANTLQRWLTTGRASARRELADDYLSFVSTKQLYDQVRFIGPDGREVVRIDLNAGNPVIRSDSELQNKSNRYYFQETVRLGPGWIYVSPLDLNIENGVVSRPIRPTVRFGAPVFDFAGRKRGVIVINHSAQNLLDGIRKIVDRPKNKVWLLNEASYWLIGRQGEEWGFMYGARSEQTFARAYPDAWKRVLASPSGGQFFSGEDLFTYAAAESFPSLDKAKAIIPSWFFVTRVPADVFAKMRWDTAHGFIVVTGVIIVLVGAVSALIAVSHTGRKAAAEKNREHAIRLHGYLESCQDAVVVANSDGIVEFANACVERIFGYWPEELIGRPVETLVPQRYHERHVKDRAVYMAAPQLRLMGEKRDLYGVKADGSEIPVAVSLDFTEIDGRPVAIATIKDVSEIQARDRAIAKLNESLAEQNRSLESANRELEAFSYSVSHDLRAPLRSMDGFSQALLEDYGEQLDEQGRHYLGRVRRSAQNMGSLIDDMLTLSRVTREELHRESFDLSRLAREIVEEQQRETPDREFAFDVADGLVAKGDRHMVRIALENLIGNACKFTAPRARPRIEIGQVRLENETPFYVRDNGVGFDMKFAEKLFVAFQRLHDASRFPGTGIGLAIVQRVISKHGGRVWAEAKPDVGATFYFTL